MCVLVFNCVRFANHCGNNKKLGARGRRVLVRVEVGIRVRYRVTFRVRVWVRRVTFGVGGRG